jgi:hypothetical protein
MLEIATECRQSNRRSVRGGGRRATDSAVTPSDLPTCPACRRPGVASLAGESEGGWWFVCLACDHLWDQRQVGQDIVRVEGNTPEPPFWRRLPFLRAHAVE